MNTPSTQIGNSENVLNNLDAGQYRLAKYLIALSQGSDVLTLDLEDVSQKMGLGAETVQEYLNGFQELGILDYDSEEQCLLFDEDFVSTENVCVRTHAVGRDATEDVDPHLVDTKLSALQYRVLDAARRCEVDDNDGRYFVDDLDLTDEARLTGLNLSEQLEFLVKNGYFQSYCPDMGEVYFPQNARCAELSPAPCAEAVQKDVKGELDLFLKERAGRRVYTPKSNGRRKKLEFARRLKMKEKMKLSLLQRFHAACSRGDLDAAADIYENELANLLTVDEASNCVASLDKLRGLVDGRTVRHDAGLQRNSIWDTTDYMSPVNGLARSVSVAARRVS